MLPPPPVSAVLLVEGRSDAAVVRVLARRRGIPVDGPGIRLLPTGGATGAARTLRGLAERPDVVLALCDEREAHHVEQALIGRRGAVFVCRPDLEGELIDALGMAPALDVLAATGDLRSFRTLQGQPDHRGRAPEQQLHRYLAAGAGRKERLDAALAEALEAGQEPPPLRQLLAALEAIS